jgi:hypothetical protein
MLYHYLALKDKIQKDMSYTEASPSKMHKLKLLLIILALFLQSCSLPDEKQQNNLRRNNRKGEYIYRIHNEYLFAAKPPKPKDTPSYPWEEGKIGNIQKITKEYFRCRGSSLNPPRTIEENGSHKNLFDCGGSEKHSLPLRDGKEFIYSVLIDILNYVQASTQKKVVITSGHRCPEHNTYVDTSKANQSSKHMIGAEVSFYVQGLENQPDKIARIIQQYYQQSPKYSQNPQYTHFKAYDKDDKKPLFNKEIFIKLYNANEGRNFDNRHPYPYITIQVRHDRDLDQQVLYTWDRANRNFLRK